MSHTPYPEPSDAPDSSPLGRAGTSPPNPAKTSGTRLLTTTLCVVAVAIVAVPLLYKGLAQELGRWRLAAASELRLNGELAAAIRSLDSALESDPNHVELYLQRAAWHDELKNHEAALQDYRQVQKLAGDDPRMLLGRALTYHRMGKPTEALGDLQQLVSASTPAERANALNTHAYFRALNNTELDEALVEIDKSIDMVGPQPALLDTRGFIRYRLGDLTAARNDLESAVAAYESHLDLPGLQHPATDDPLKVADLRVHKFQMEREKQVLAVVIYHRGLIYEALGEAQLAKADFDTVTALGFEPNDELF